MHMQLGQGRRPRRPPRIRARVLASQLGRRFRQLLANESEEGVCTARTRCHATADIVASAEAQFDQPVKVDAPLTPVKWNPRKAAAALHAAIYAACDSSVTTCKAIALPLNEPYVTVPVSVIVIDPFGPVPTPMLDDGAALTTMNEGFSGGVLGTTFHFTVSGKEVSPVVPSTAQLLVANAPIVPPLIPPERIDRASPVAPVHGVAMPLNFERTAGFVPPTVNPGVNCTAATNEHVPIAPTPSTGGIRDTALAADPPNAPNANAVNITDTTIFSVTRIPLLYATRTARP